MVKRLPEPTPLSDPVSRGYLNELIRELQFEFISLENLITALSTPNITFITSAYTPSISDGTIVITSGTFAVTLPSAVDRFRKVYNIKNSGSGTITMNTTGGQLIDGDASGAITLIQYESLTVQSDGTNWMVL